MRERRKLDDVLSKFMRFGWEVAPARNQFSLARDITKSLIREIELSPDFREPPPKGLLQSIAHPTYLYLRRTIDPALNRKKGRNPLYSNLTQKEIEALDRYYYWNRKYHHGDILHLVDERRQIPVITSHIAATFAYTTLMVPNVISFERLVKEVDDSTFEETLELEFCRKSAILIVTDALRSCKRLKTVDGDVAGFLDSRSKYHRITVFVDVVQSEDVNETLDQVTSEQHTMDRKLLEVMLDKSGVGTTHSYKQLLKSIGTYVNFNTSQPVGGINEWSRDRFFI